ncbi:11081_t:CDS:1 [Ambispora gerdemannii]|uniref:11081_t:CDS:1 n=1 Tax=Ambispora gerdemannii TaxID=144530 RepID=A0A9N8YMI1_9GLOM|nr:11081_t:CDS:1 [Ambispora gerdemannii]
MISDSYSSPISTPSPASSSTLTTTPILTHGEFRSSPKYSSSDYPLPTRTTGVPINCLVNASVTIVPSGNNWDQPPEYLYVFGGFHQYTDEVYNDLYRLNVSEMKWEDVIYLKNSPPSKRNDHTASLWNDDKLVIFGGMDAEDQFCNDIVYLNLKTMTWERPVVQGNIPPGRAKHSATIYQDKLYIVGGTMEEGEVLMGVNCLDLITWTWEEPFTFVKRHSHFSFVYQGRLFVYGGYTEEMDRESSLAVIDLQTKSISKIDIMSDIAPEMNGQHFAQSCGDKLMVVVTQSPKYGAQEVNTGVWALDLKVFQWDQHKGGERLVQGNWHYFAMAEHSPRFFLFGMDEKDSDEYFSNVLCVDLQEYGILQIPPSSMCMDFRNLFDDQTTSDFTIRAQDMDSKPISVHKIILLARWPHFNNMISSGMTESFSTTLTIPESYPTVHAFILFLYTDNIDETLPTQITADLLILGHMYFLPRLIALCRLQLNQNLEVDNAAIIYHCASVAGENGLKKRALRFINTNFGPVSKTNGFRTLPKSVLFDFLDSLPEKAKISVNDDDE